MSTQRKSEENPGVLSMFFSLCKWLLQHFSLTFVQICQAAYVRISLILILVPKCVNDAKSFREVIK